MLELDFQHAVKHQLTMFGQGHFALWFRNYCWAQYAFGGGSSEIQKIILKLEFVNGFVQFFAQGFGFARHESMLTDFET